MSNNILSFLGLAMKSGNLASGETAALQAVKSSNAYYVIIADDASHNTKKRFSNSCHYYRVPYCFYASKEQLGHAIGKEYRSVLAITDSKMADAIRSKMDLH